MIDLKIENKLTPAAKSALEEIIKDYREQILLSASRIAVDVTGKLEEISIRDILKAIEETDIKIKSKKTRIKDRLYATLMLAGLFYSFIGVTFTVIYPADNLLYRPAIIVSFVGIIIAISAYFIQRFKRNAIYTLQDKRSYYKNDLRHLSFIFTSNWSIIEIELRDLFSATFGESNASIPLFKMFGMFISKSILTEKDAIALKNLLDMRNNIMHAYREFSTDELQFAIKETEKWIDKLRKTSTSNRPML